MNQKQCQVEQRVALWLMAFSIGLLVGEAVRDQLFAQPIGDPENLPEKEQVPGRPGLKKGKKGRLFSGLFLLLKHRLGLSTDQMNQKVNPVVADFAILVQHPVRTYV